MPITSSKSPPRERKVKVKAKAKALKSLSKPQMDSAALTVGLGSSSSSTFRLKSPSLATATLKQPPSPPSLISFRPSLRFPISYSNSTFTIKASSNSTPINGGSSQNPIIRNLKTAAAIAVVLAAAVAAKFRPLPVKAETLPSATEESVAEVNQLDYLQKQQHQEEEEEEEEKFQNPSSPLSQFLDSNSEAVEALKSVLQQKLDAGEDEEALKILQKLVSAQPEQTEWKFLTARLLNEMGKTLEAREVFEEILKLNPLSFEALFENALLMDRCGEGTAVITRLEEALRIAEDENKAKEARDVRLIMAQIQFLQKNVDEALKSYDELAKEDPSDFRPYFCKGMIYSLLDQNKEAREEFAKYRELSPKKFEVEGYLRTPLSRMKLFGTNEDN